MIRVIAWGTLILSAVLLVAIPLEAATVHRIVLIPELDARSARTLEREVPGLLVDRVEPAGATVYATAAALKELDRRNQPYQVLYQDERDRARAVAHRTGRPWPETSYTEMRTWMQNLAAAYPSITRYHVYGTSVNGRDLIALEINDDPDLDDPTEPEVRMQGNIHGDEYMSLELMCLLADDLCTGYGSDPEVTALVDDLEIWVLPSINPDGHTAGTRTNAHGVDLNRNHGYMWVSGYGYGARSFSEPELQHWFWNALERNYSVSLSFHGETTYFNYPWNFTGENAPDRSLFQQLGSGYTALENGYTVTEGWDWYQTNGDTDDWSYGARGDLDVTIETPGYSSSAIANDWDDNQEAIRYFLGEARRGVRGVVTDAATGAPLPALVQIVERSGWPGYTDPGAGDYHRLLPAGSYHLRFWANGYGSVDSGTVTVGGGAATIQDVSLSRAYQAHAYQVAWNQVDDHYETYSSASQWEWEGLPHQALGPPDDVPGSLSRGGELCLDLGAGFAAMDGPGMDLTIHEADVGDGDESCQLHGSNDPFGSWTPLGTVTGTTEIDLAGSGLGEVRFLRFVDDGNGSYDGAAPGYDLDAVSHPWGSAGCGQLELDSLLHACQSSPEILLLDEDLDQDPGSVETVSVQATSDSEPTGRSVELVETGPASGQFQGILALDPDGVSGLAVAHGDTLEVSYQDADCQGSPETVTVTTSIDCQGPQIVNVRVQEQTETSVEIRWSTDEPADSSVRYGVVEPILEIHEPGLTLDHQVTITGLNPCTGYIYAPGSADGAANQTWDDRQGSYYGFATAGMELLVEASMDSDPGWNDQGEWAWGIPQGNLGDPSSGYTGTRVYGYDLGGTYGNDIPAHALTTPDLDCSDAEGVRLSFWRWLGVESSSYDHATLEVSGNSGASWSQVWANPATELTDTEWTYCEYDISPWADGHSQVRIRWLMGPTDYSEVYAGWNLDDVRVSYRYDCPSPTPRPTHTPTPAVTATQVPSASPTPDGTPTAVPEEIGLRLILNAPVFRPGDPFHLGLTSWNRSALPRSVALFVLLDVAQDYWFWPDWTQELAYQNRALTVGQEIMDEPILEFQWPQGTGSLAGIRFWAAFTDPGLSSLIGELDVVEWSYEGAP